MNNLQVIANKLGEEKIKVFGLAVENNFYPLDIMFCLVMEDNYILKYWGFMIYSKKECGVWIKYIFIKPEYRRKGIFTEIINNFKCVFERITFESREKSMKEFAKKHNFKKIRLCLNNKDILYGWNKIKIDLKK